MINARKLFFFVLTAKAALVLAVVALFGSQKLMWSADALEYADLGQNLVAGRGFSRTAENGFIPAADRMPLYPFIVGLDPSLILVSVAQIIAAALISLFTYRIAQRFLPGRWPVAAALIAAFEPLSAVLHMLILPETLLALFILIFVDVFLLYLERGEAKFIFFSALALLCILYTKPVAMYFLPFPILILLWHRRKEALLPALILIGVFFAGVTPWMLRNMAIGEGFTISTYGQKALCGYQISAVLASHYGFRETTPGIAMGEIRNFEEYRRREQECFAKSPLATTIALAKDYPADFFKVNTLAALGYFTNDGYLQIFQSSSAFLPPHHNYLTPAVLAGPRWKENFGTAFGELSSFEKAVFVGGRILWIAVFLLALLGAAAGLKNREMRAGAALLILTVFYFAASSILGAAFGAGARYRFEINSLLFIFALLGLLWFKQLLSGWTAKYSVLGGVTAK